MQATITTKQGGNQIAPEREPYLSPDAVDRQDPGAEQIPPTPPRNAAEEEGPLADPAGAGWRQPDFGEPPLLRTPPKPKPGSALGLEPRYLRERRRAPQPVPASEEATTPPPALPVLFWQPHLKAHPPGTPTSELRQRVLKAAAPKPWHRPGLLVVPVMFGLAALAWLALGSAALLASHLLQLL